MKVNNYEIFGIVPQGWQCPICKNILSPNTIMCPCRGQGRNTYIYTTTSNNINQNQEDLNNEHI